MDRTQLFDTLSNLPPAAFERLLFALKPPGGLIPGDTAPQMNRVKALLDWAEGSSGRGLEEILVYLNQLHQGTLPTQGKDLPNFQLYLQSILENEDYIEWQEVYTPTTVEDRQQVPVQDAATVSQRRFSSRLKLRAETVKLDPQEQGNQPDGAPKPQERVEQWDVLAGLRNYAAEHVVLIGKPGSGKSTSLERLLWEETEKALHDPTARIPVLVKLRRCTGTIEGLIRDFLMGHQVAVEIAQIEELLGQGRFLLLLDGLNELPERFRTEIANFRDRYHSTTPMIVSTRELNAGGTLSITKTLQMLPLTEPQMQEFVRGYLGNEGDRLFQQLQGDRLHKFAETPLLLWMLCRVFAEECIQTEKEKRTPKLPENLGLAFREFTQLYDHGTDEHQAIQEDAPVDSRDQWPKLLRHLAFVMMQGKTLIDPELSISKEEAEDCLTAYLQQEGRSNPRECAERWLKDLLEFHLIQPVIQPNFEEHIEFRHQLIQEYYAAEYLLKLLPTLTDDQLKQDHLNYLKWTESMALMLALEDKEAQALQVVKLALDVDWRLAARLAGEVKPAFQTQTVKLVEELEAPDWLKVELLGETRSEVAIPKLLPFLRCPNINIAEVAASYIGETHDQVAIDVLTSRLEEISNQFFSQQSFGGPDKTGILWSTHVQAFSYISPQLATKFLRNKLADYGTLLLMVTQAAQILMQLDAENMIPELLEEFRSAQNEENRKIATGWKEPEREIQMSDSVDSTAKIDADIINLLRNTKITPPSSESRRRNYILNLLENSSRYELFIADLIRVFDQEPDKSLRKQIIQILGKSKHDAAIHFLIQNLSEDSNGLRAEAAKQLINLNRIDNSEDLEELKNLARHEDWNISWCAAVILGHLRDSAVLPRMMDELENHQAPSIRSTAARVLGIIGDSNCVTSLLKAINSDADRYVQINAACSLSNFDRKEAK